MAAVAGDLYRTVELTVVGLGYQLVDIERLGGGLLRVTMEGAEGIKVEDCERVSRQLSHVFAVDDVDYQRLEVSSPGLDRSLKGANNFLRFIGSEINVQLYAPSAEAGGRKRLRGRLVELVGDQGCERLRLELSSEEAGVKNGSSSPRSSAKLARRAQAGPGVVVELALAAIEKARLVPELNFRPAPAAVDVDSAGVGNSGLMSKSPSGSLKSEHP